MVYFLLKILEVIIYSLLFNTPKVVIKVVTVIKVVVVVLCLPNNPKVVVRVVVLYPLLNNLKVVIKVLYFNTPEVVVRVVKVLYLPLRLPKYRKSGRRIFEII